MSDVCIGQVVGEEISNYKLELVGVQEVRWDRGGTKPAGKLRLFLWEWQSES
jgi:hypothetical protein